MTRRSIIVWIRRGEGRARAKAWALLDYAGHWPSQCNVGLMSLAGHGPKSGSRHVYLIMIKTGQQGVNDAARPPEGGPTEAGGFQPQVCHGAIDRLVRMPDSQLKSLCTKQWVAQRYLTNVPLDGRAWHKAFFGWVRAQGYDQPANKGNPSKESSNLGGSPLRFKEINHPAKMPDSQSKKQGLIQLFSYSQWETYRLSLTITQIRQINFSVLLL